MTDSEYVPTPLASVFFSILDSQRAADNEPCPTCSGDRLRADFAGSGRCHVERTS